MKIKEQLAAFEAKRAAHAARMEELMTKAAEEDRTLDEAEQDEYDGLDTELGSVDSHLKRLRSLEKLALEKATPVTGVRSVEEGSALRGAVFSGGTPTIPKGMAQVAMSPMKPGRPPRATNRRSPIQIASSAPTMMQNA